VLFGTGASEVRRRRAPLRPTVVWKRTRPVLTPARPVLAPTGTDGLQ